MIKTYMYPKAKEHKRTDTDDFIVLSVERYKDEQGLLPICSGVWHDENGKPHLYDEGLYVSASHTDSQLIVAVSDKPVGVDIEKASRTVHSRELIIKKYFSQNERAYVLKSVSGQNKRFLEIWVKKESYVKLTGKGISEMKHISVNDNSLNAVFEKVLTSEELISYVCYTN